MKSGCQDACNWIPWFFSCAFLIGKIASVLGIRSGNTRAEALHWESSHSLYIQKNRNENLSVKRGLLILFTAPNALELSSCSLFSQNVHWRDFSQRWRQLPRSGDSILRITEIIRWTSTLIFWRNLTRKDWSAIFLFKREKKKKRENEKKLNRHQWIV